MNKIKSFFRAHKAYIAAGLCFTAALISGYMIQKNEIKKENMASDETQAFITEANDEKVLPSSDSSGSDSSRAQKTTSNYSKVTLPEAFPDDGTREELVTKDDPFLSVAKTNSFSPQMPLSGTISKGYSVSPVYSVTLDDWRSHEAVDISSDEGDSVSSIEKGTVTGVGRDPLLGVYVKIDHQNGFESLYFNLHTETTVQEGQEIEKGHQIGYVGRTSVLEQADSPHLHFELKKDGKKINPKEYIK